MVYLEKKHKNNLEKMSRLFGKKSVHRTAAPIMPPTKFSIIPMMPTMPPALITRRGVVVLLVVLLVSYGCSVTAIPTATPMMPQSRETNVPILKTVKSTGGSFSCRIAQTMKHMPIIGRKMHARVRNALAAMNLLQTLELKVVDDHDDDDDDDDVEFVEGQSMFTHTDKPDSVAQAFHKP